MGAPDAGESVAISSDGNTVIVGGEGDNSRIGAAWIFVRSGSTWTQQGPKLVGTNAIGTPTQGRAVAISSDGNTAIVGGEQDSNGTGAAWVFVRNGGAWTQQGPKLVANDVIGSTSAPAFGISVALSPDGNTALIGGFGDNYDVGATWVFARSGTVWTPIAKLIADPGPPTFGQGYAVALSADGNTALVASSSDENYTGALWAFVRSGGAWQQQGSKLVGTGAVGAAAQGCSMSLSADGNTVIEGGCLDNGYMGAAWVFTRSNGVWSQQGAKLVGVGSVGTTVEQGGAVSLSADGNTALIGGLSDNGGFGATWVFKRVGGVWTQQGNKFTGAGAAGTVVEQGAGLALSADGSTAVVGGSYDNEGFGAIWIFTATSSTFTNGSFETPVLPAGGYQYGPGGAGWTFGGGAGIQRNGSAWNGATAPDGQQTAFLQGANAQLGQTINLAAGSYSLSFYAARRAYQGAGQPLQITVDGTPIGSPIAPADTSFARYTSASFTVTAGPHTLMFTSTNPDGDNSSFIDAVVLNVLGNQPPAIVSANATTFTVGQAGTFTVQSTGVPTSTLSNSGVLPAGVTFVDNGNGTATLSGTPAANTNGSYTLTITAHNGAGADAAQSFTLTVNAASVTMALANGNFETPVLAAGGYQYPPSNAGWTFGGGTGIQRNGSAWGAATAPEGQQTAFLQGYGAQLSQTINFGTGTYSVSFYAARRAYQGAGQPLQISIDGVAVGSPIAPVDTSFAPYSSVPFTVGAGNHTLMFTSTNPDGDNSSFIDAVVLNVLGDQPPAIISPNATTFSVGQTGSFTVQATGVPVPTLSRSGALPAGVTFIDNGNGTATLSGIPSVNSNGTYTLILSAHNGVGGDATQTFTLTVNAAPVTIALPNGGFETPILAAGSYQYPPSNASWTFGGGTGIQRNGSAWGGANAPEGQQTAFLQGYHAQLSQTINLAAGTYNVSFYAARRAYQGAGQPLQISIDGTAIGSPIAPTDTNFARYTSATFSVGAGNHALLFTSTNPDGDNSSFIDAVVLNML